MNTLAPCPPWCALPREHDLDDDEGRFHVGPTFGRYYACRTDGEPTCLVETSRESEFFDPADLRRNAADLLAAAAWLETHR